jgi:guanine deaminase
MLEFSVQSRPKRERGALDRAGSDGMEGGFMVVGKLSPDAVNSAEQTRFISRAIELAVENVKQGGGPFGAVIVRNGEIIGEGANRVTRDFDPTAHGEVVALRAACAHEKQFHLPDAVLYTSCEPCPMCLAAAYWAHIPTIYFAADAESAAKAGFADAFLYEQFRLPRDQRDVTLIHMANVDGERAFRTWNESANKVEY